MKTSPIRQLKPRASGPQKAAPAICLDHQWRPIGLKSPDLSSPHAYGLMVRCTHCQAEDFVIPESVPLFFSMLLTGCEPILGPVEVPVSWPRVN